MTPLHSACLSLGSNIDPAHNLTAALRLLEARGRIERTSHIWESQAVGSAGPDFLNLSLLLLTPDDIRRVKTDIIRPIEAQLGRVRTADKNAPRTIDLDLIVFDGRPLTAKLWELAFVAVPTAEILPDLINSGTGATLAETAARLRASSRIRIRDGIPCPGPPGDPAADG